MNFMEGVRLPLNQELFQNAKLFANRYELIKSLKYREYDSIAEIGVSIGGFSKFMIENLQPNKFAAFDLFNYHELELVLGKPSSEMLLNMEHDEYIRHVLSGYGAEIKTFKGSSLDTLKEIEDNSFDLIYIDGLHTFAGVENDTKNAIRMLRPFGVIVFNDYIVFDHLLKENYGVIEVANQLLHTNNYDVIGLGLEPGMFCDLAIRRKF